MNFFLKAFEALKIIAEDAAGPKSVLDLLLHKKFTFDLSETGKYSHPLLQKLKNKKKQHNSRDAKVLDTYP